LPDEAYVEAGSAWHVTIGFQDRQSSLLKNEELALEITNLLAVRAKSPISGLHLYCLMPDHLHLLVEVTNTGLVEVVGELKSTTTRMWWKHGGQGRLWQSRFYDHGIRGSRDLEATIAYIVNNPVKAGIVKEWEEYPYIAGTLISQP
jgi:REP element-mobilizing transposase RayT